MNSNLVEQMQKFIAETCIGASALRNQGGSGLVDVARKHFKMLDLAAIPTTEQQFSEWLDKQTDELRQRFPNGAQKFGTARKALNLFLRSAAYNVVLNRAFHLERIIPLLEIPLDSYAAAHLAAHDPALPKKWARVKSVSSDEHRAYQNAARKQATVRRINRVDLDVFFFREAARTR